MNEEYEDAREAEELMVQIVGLSLAALAIPVLSIAAVLLVFFR